MRRLATWFVAAIVIMGLAGCGDVLKDSSLTVGTSFSKAVQLTAPASAPTSVSQSVSFSPGTNGDFQTNKAKLTKAGLDSIKIEVQSLGTGNKAQAITGATVKLTDATTSESHTYTLGTVTLAPGTSVAVKNFVETASSTGQTRAISDFFSSILTRSTATDAHANDFTLDLAGTLDQVPVDVSCLLTMDVSLTITGG